MSIWINEIYRYLALNMWILECLAIVVMALLVRALLAFSVRYIENRLHKSKAHIVETLTHALHKPLGVLIWLVSGTLILEVLAEQFLAPWVIWAIYTVQELLIVLLFVWLFFRLISRIENYLVTVAIERRAIDRTTVRAIGQISRGVVIVAGVLMALQVLPPKILGVLWSMLALGGFGTIAIGFAARDMLSNIFGSMMVFLDRPFEVGQWVRVPEHNIEGTVESIGWRLTRVRTFDHRPMYIPNSIFSQAVVENPSRMTHRRINSLLGVRYQDADKINNIVQDVKAMLKNHPGIDSTQILMVNFVEFGQSSLNFIIYAFTYTVDWDQFFDVRQDIYLKAIDIIHHHEAQCALPVTTLNFAEPLSVQQLTTQE